MAIVLNGKKLAEAWLNGKKLKEAWINGHRVFPSVPMLNVQPARLDFPADGGSKDFIIESNEAWTITCDYLSPYILSKTSGSGNDTVTVSVGKNTGSPQQRTLTVRSTLGLEKTVVLFQEAETYGSTSWIFNMEWTVSNINIREGLVYMGERLPVVQITPDGHQVISIPKEIADNDHLIFSFRALYTPAIDSTLNIIINKLSGSPSMYSAKGSSGSYSMSPINTGILINNITKIELVIT